MPLYLPSSEGYTSVCLSRCIRFWGTLLTKFTHEPLSLSRHVAVATSPPRSTFTPTSKPVAMVKMQARTIGARIAHMPRLDKLHMSVPAAILLTLLPSAMFA